VLISLVSGLIKRLWSLSAPGNFSTAVVSKLDAGCDVWCRQWYT